MKMMIVMMDIDGDVESNCDRGDVMIVVVLFYIYIYMIPSATWKYVGLYHFIIHHHLVSYYLNFCRYECS